VRLWCCTSQWRGCTIGDEGQLGAAILDAIPR
jgi:hypothetical protein